MARKFLIFIIILFVLGFIGFAIWFFFFFQKDVALNPFNNESEEPTTQLFPATQNGTQPNDNEEDSGLGFQVAGEDEEIPKLRQISMAPVSGFTTFTNEVVKNQIKLVENEENPDEKPKEVEEEVTITEDTYRFIERGTGHLYETTENTLNNSRLSNITIPKIQEAIFNSNGNNVLFRYLDSDQNIIETTLMELFVPKSTTSTTTERTEESKLIGNIPFPGILSIAVSPSKNSYFYLLDSGLSTQVSGYITDFGQKGGVNVFNSPLKQWIIDWPTLNQITLTSKAHSSAEGVMFTLNTKSGATEKIIYGKKGLTTLMSPDGKYVLYSESQQNKSVELFIRDIASNSDISLNLQGLPEKCVWSKTNEFIIYCAVPSPLLRGDYPEDWYLGNTSFNDNIWKIDLEKLEYDLLLSNDRQEGFPTDKFDVVNPQLSADEDHFIFMNKKDLTLWDLRLKD